MKYLVLLVAVLFVVIGCNFVTVDDSETTTVTGSDSYQARVLVVDMDGALVDGVLIEISDGLETYIVSSMGGTASHAIKADKYGARELGTTEWVYGTTVNNVILIITEEV